MRCSISAGATVSLAAGGDGAAHPGSSTSGPAATLAAAGALSCEALVASTFSWTTAMSPCGHDLRGSVDVEPIKPCLLTETLGITHQARCNFFTREPIICTTETYEFFYSVTKIGS